MKKLATLLLIIAVLLCSVTVAVASDRYDLDDYGYRTVKTKGRGSLVFQKSPRGSFMKDYRYGDGDRIYVNLEWREDGYAIAYDVEDEVYGYVDASYIDWKKSGSGGKKDLSNYEYRTVRIKGSGSLVFQKSPRGDFMYDYKYWNGDEIFVNVDWREEGYAIAYDEDDEVYGYVDARYIDWNSGDDDEYDLDNFEYRTVKTKGRGSLVFQRSPRGSFMNAYRYDDGDRILVNVDWRKDGYAIAYDVEDEVYGYVDASYIKW